MVLHDAMADALGSRGLTVTQYAVLTALDEEPGLSNADLARRAFVTPQSMHAVLQELERLQLVVRRPHPQHQRVLQAELTEAGRRTLKSAAKTVDAVEEQMLRKLSDPRDRDWRARSRRALMRSPKPQRLPARVESGDCEGTARSAPVRPCRVEQAGPRRGFVLGHAARASAADEWAPRGSTPRPPACKPSRKRITRGQSWSPSSR